MNKETNEINCLPSIHVKKTKALHDFEIQTTEIMVSSFDPNDLMSMLKDALDIISKK